MRRAHRRRILVRRKPRRQRGNDLELGLDPRGSGALKLTREARGRHLYCVGAIGTGKSKFMEHLIRQDILNWPKSQCGLIVFDPHGAMFDSLMRWIAAKGLRHLPIVPIDLRRPDSVVSYNVLRRRTVGEASVVVGGLARAIIHAWGQGNMDDTPRLAKWLPVILGTLYERGHTLLDSLHLFCNPEVRRAMTADVKNFVTRTVWDMTADLRPAEFQEEVSSTMNRLMRFLGNQTMRAMLCQTGPSLDLGEAIERGSIILVSMATAGTQIDDEDAHTFGSMLLSDLWTAAKSRGKKDEGAGGVKPFYTYIDEFQEFLTPSMATTLDQARGFGIHLTMAQQFPSQLTGRGEIGRLVFNSVMANARSKVVFQLDHPEDLPTLAMWLGRNQIDVDAVKHQHYSTKVMGHETVYLPTYGSSTSVTQGDASSTGSAQSQSIGRASAVARGVSRSMHGSHGEGQSSGESWLEDGTSIPIAGDFPYTASEGRSQTDSAGRSEGDSANWSDSEMWNETINESESRTSIHTRGKTESVSYAPMLRPIMGMEALPPQFRSVEEQIFSVTQMLAAQPERHAVARLSDATSFTPIRIPFVRDGMITRRYTEHWTAGLLAKLPFTLRMEDALRQLDERQSTFVESVLAPNGRTEPTSFRRRVAVRRLPPADGGPAAAPVAVPKGPTDPEPLTTAATP